MALGLRKRECCLQNYFCQHSGSVSSFKNNEVILPNELDSFCLFPKNFLNITPIVYIHLLNHEDLKIQENFRNAKMTIDTNLMFELSFTYPYFLEYTFPKTNQNQQSVFYDFFQPVPNVKLQILSYIEKKRWKLEKLI